MKTITLRNLPPKLLCRIRQRARERGTSATRAVVSLLEQTLGVAKKPASGKAYHDLDWFFGSWTREEADEFDRHLSEIRRMDG